MPRAAPGHVPFHRDVRVLRILLQVAFLGLVVLIGAFFYANLVRSAQRLGIGIGFGFLGLEAGFAIGETPIAYEPSDSYARAFLVGAVNTLRVSLAGIVLATVLGGIIGIARLSGNWLIRQLAGVYVEVFRNCPLLLQIFFWFFAVFLALPPPREAIGLGGRVFLTNRGVALPWPQPGPGFPAWAAVTAAAWVVAALVYRRLLRVKVETGRETRPGVVSLLLAAGGPLAAWVAVPGPVVSLDVPRLAGFNFQGGAWMTVQFAALLVALVAYTSAFIAEVVRGGILAVSKGQFEAARALGLPPALVLRLVVIPQALRVIVPPLTSQYLNLTKNSSLAAAIGYPDLFGVAHTILNQSGRTFETMALVMASYLAFSLATSMLMNLYNRSVRLVER